MGRLIHHAIQGASQPKNEEWQGNQPVRRLHDAQRNCARERDCRRKPHCRIGARQVRSCAARHFARGDPFQQVSPRDKHAPKCLADCCQTEKGIIWQERQGKSDLAERPFR